MKRDPFTPPRIALLVIGDGRDHLRARTIESWHAMARDYELVTLVEVDDRDHALGFCGAWRSGMRLAGMHHLDFDYVFHLEEDWEFNRAFSIADMATILERPWDSIGEHQAWGYWQVALQRNPISAGEIAAGGVTRQWPDSFAQRQAGPIEWLDHQLFLTTNPNLIHRRSCAIAARFIADPPRCEEALGQSLMRSSWRFAYLGRGDDEPWITHTGQRQGTGY